MKKKSYLMTYGGDAFSEKLNAPVGLIMYAHNEAEALERYKECIARHPHLKAADNPHICLCIGMEDLPWFEKHVKPELDKYHSAEV